MQSKSEWLSQCVSEAFLYEIGVRQGCILSPLLFNLFINEVTKPLEETKIGVHVGDILLRWRPKETRE